MPALTGIIETALYVDDMDRASRFYEEILGLHRIGGDKDRLHVYSVADRNVLLLFKRGATAQPVQTPIGVVPPHDGNGPLHLAFAISKEDLQAWEETLKENGIIIESRIHWPRGGTSIYFRDPDNNLVELATPGMWPIY
jgi:catechol 2,3-dioxygenase-like lactoylglutathione lyase family enzyme